MHSLHSPIVSLSKNHILLNEWHHIRQNLLWPLFQQVIKSLESYISVFSIFNLWWSHVLNFSPINQKACLLRHTVKPWILSYLFFEAVPICHFFLWRASHSQYSGNDLTNVMYCGNMISLFQLNSLAYWDWIELRHCLPWEVQGTFWLIT